MVHLPRDLRNTHRWSKEQAKKALRLFGLRKAYTFKDQEKQVEEKQSKDYHRQRKCPYSGCYAVVRRIAGYLKEEHGLKPHSSCSKSLIEKAQKQKTWKPKVFSGKNKRRSAAKKKPAIAVE